MIIPASNNLLDKNPSVVSSNNRWFFFTCFFLVIDYCRPQDVFRPIGYIKPGMIAIVILVYYIFTNFALVQSVKNKQKNLVIYFVALCSLYVPFVVNNFWAYITLRTMLLYLPFILSVVALIDSFDKLKKMITVNMVIMNYVCLYGITHGGRGSGNYFTDENDIAMYACMWIPFAFYLFFVERGKMRLFHAFSLAVAVITVVVSFSRGGFVGLLAVFAVIWLFSPKKIVSLIFVLIIAGIIWLSTDTAYKTEMSTVTDTTEGTATERLQSWQAGWDMFLDNPLGVGGNNFQTRFPEYQPPEMKKNMWGRVAHSLWFTLIPELGFFGIIIYMRLLYYNLKDIFFVKKVTQKTEDFNSRYLHHLSLAYVASLAGFFAAATFISVLYYAHYWYMTGYIVATANIVRKKLATGNVL